MPIIVVLAALFVRQLVILLAIIRSARFIRTDSGLAPVGDPAPNPEFFVVLPVLREAAVIADAVGHFVAMTRPANGHVVVVTTEREAAEASRQPPQPDTVAVVRELALRGQCDHLHFPDPTGLKADQLNYAAQQLTGHRRPGDVFLVCYDADSRPPLGSLRDFAAAIRANPQAEVFHQSSRFELRIPSSLPRRQLLDPGRVVCDGGALRANRFVLGFEIPRLRNRSGDASRAKRWLASYVYAHVTGHGLCVRQSLIRRLPFPTRSLLEDMHYSFYLGSRNMPMVAVASLDVAEVPDTATAQVKQAARWFIGPGRFRRYLRDPVTQPGLRARMMAASACGSAGEWLGCLLVPPAVLALAVVGNTAITVTATGVIVAYVAQLWVADRALNPHESTSIRLARVVGAPFAAMLHGAGGFVGLARLVAGVVKVDKTERW